MAGLTSLRHSLTPNTMLDFKVSEGKMISAEICQKVLSGSKNEKINPK